MTSGVRHNGEGDCIFDFSGKSEADNYDYGDFLKIKNFLYNKYSLLDESRFFDVISQSNARFWQQIGEINPIDLIKTTQDEVAIITINRLCSEVSIERFCEIANELVEHVRYTQNSPDFYGQFTGFDLSKQLLDEFDKAINKFDRENYVIKIEKCQIVTQKEDSEEIQKQSLQMSKFFTSEINNVFNNKKHVLWARLRLNKVSMEVKIPIVKVKAEWGDKE